MTCKQKGAGVLQGSSSSLFQHIRQVQAGRHVDCGSIVAPRPTTCVCQTRDLGDETSKGDLEQIPFSFYIYYRLVQICNALFTENIS